MTHQHQLVRALSLTDASALVVGTVIGTGVFLKAAPMLSRWRSRLGASRLGCCWPAFTRGALTYAELSSMMPDAVASMSTCANRMANQRHSSLDGNGSSLLGALQFASLGVGFSIFLSTLVPMGEPWLEHDIRFLGQTVHWQLGLKQLIGVLVIALLTAINCLLCSLRWQSTRCSDAAQKSAALPSSSLVFTFSSGTNWSNLATPSQSQWNGLSAFGTAMLAALWAMMAGTTCLWQPAKCASRAQHSARPDSWNISRHGHLLYAEPRLLLCPSLWTKSQHLRRPSFATRCPWPRAHPKRFSAILVAELSPSSLWSRPLVP